MTPNPTLNALDLLDRAEEFFEAYRQLPPSSTRQFISWPRYFLFCHAVEIGLKAFLVSRGVSEAKLRRVGHKIDPLMRAALGKGLAIGVLAASELMLLDEAHAKHWPRYPRRENKPVFVIDAFEPYARKLLEEVSNAIRGRPGQIVVHATNP